MTTKCEFHGCANQLDPNMWQPKTGMKLCPDHDAEFTRVAESMDPQRMIAFWCKSKGWSSLLDGLREGGRMTTRLLLALSALLLLAWAPAPPGCVLPGGACTRSHYAAPCPQLVGSKERRCVYHLPALVNHRGLDVRPTQTPESDPGIE